MALMGRAYNQAQKFGVEVAIPAEAKVLEMSGRGSLQRASKLRLSERGAGARLAPR